MRQLHSRRASRRHPGFSVLEMMIALLIGAVVIVTARQLLHQLTLSDRRLDDDSRREATERNGARQLTDVLNRLEVGTDSVSTFSGETTRAEFTTWCQVPRGWLERCAAALVIDTIARPNQLILVTAATR